MGGRQVHAASDGDPDGQDRSAGAREKIAKKTYIRAKGYPSVPFDAALEKIKANSAWKTYEMTAGHDAMVDQPQELTDILLQVA